MMDSSRMYIAFAARNDETFIIVDLAIAIVFEILLAFSFWSTFQRLHGWAKYTLLFMLKCIFLCVK